jgi:hypothetical protein
MSIEQPNNGIDLGNSQEPGHSRGGEDESSTERNGDDSHLHEDQKAPSMPDAAPDKGGEQQA